LRQPADRRAVLAVLALILLWTGYALCFLAGLWIVIVAWQDSVLWGVGCFLFPFLQLIYIALNWKQTKSAFFVLIAGFAALLASGMAGR
jgi:hypothetical protein